jgi:hypothetical protein
MSAAVTQCHQVHAYQQPNGLDVAPYRDAVESTEIWADRQATVRDVEWHAELNEWGNRV